MGISRGYFVIFILLLVALVGRAQNVRVTSMTAGAGGITNSSRYLQTAGDFSIVPLADHLFLGTDVNGLLQPPSITATRLIGRGSAGGAGAPEELTIGSGLSLSGTELSATGGAGSGIALVAGVGTNTTILSNFVVQAMGNVPTDGSAIPMLEMRSHTNHNLKVHSPFGISVAQGATSTANHSNTVWAIGDNPFRRDGKAAAYWVFENNWDANGGQKEIYLRFDATGVNSDYRPIFMEWGTNGSVNLCQLSGPWAVRNDNRNGTQTNYLSIGTDGANAGNHTMKGTLAFRGGNPYNSGFAMFEMGDRGIGVWRNTDESLGYHIRVDTDEKSLNFGGVESGATNINFKHWAGTGTDVNVLIPKGSLQLGPSPAIITNVLMGTATLDFPSTATQTNSDLAITVTGATTNDFPQVVVPFQAMVNACHYTWFASNDTVWIRFSNNRTNATADPPSAVFRAMVTKVR